MQQYVIKIIMAVCMYHMHNYYCSGMKAMLRGCSTAADISTELRVKKNSKGGTLASQTVMCTTYMAAFFNHCQKEQLANLPFEHFTNGLIFAHLLLMSEQNFRVTFLSQF